MKRADDGTLICRECGAKMYIDDRDTYDKRDASLYWNCTACQTSCIERIRYGTPYREDWHSENDGVKDYGIRPQH